jgi:hypothetical protein
VRVFFYLEDRERTLDNAMDKVVLSLATFASEMEREKARQRTYDAMVRKAHAGHVAGGCVFGYDNVEVLSPTPGADGKRRRQHVLRQVDPEQAAVVRVGLRPDREGAHRGGRHANAEGAACAGLAPAPAPAAGCPADPPAPHHGAVALHPADDAGGPVL